MASMQTNPVLATAATTPSYANLLYCQGSQRIRSHDLGASSQEIYARTRRIRELEKGDPETIGKYCDEVINAGANIELILDAMSALRANIGASDYPRI